ncbi:MAG: hypothetical protein LQ340_000533 [Diploschistes diacapsis]|nr:MAG: hypothetical protein LQ340_000533 [Diploschistes diacapsis]
MEQLQNSPSQTAPPHIKSLDRSASLPKPSITRFVSTSASPSATANATAASSTTQSSQSLTWDGYLSLRQKRRYYNIIASSLTALASFTGGASFLLTQDIEKISGLMFGLDPFMGMGIVCVGFGATGWLIGPFAGGFVFRLMHRRVAGGMQIKERDLYQRIKKYRCDPTSQSVQNPVPDYYGEKIFSVKGYRQWLKDQRAYRKKRESLTA